MLLCSNYIDNIHVVGILDVKDFFWALTVNMTVEKNKCNKNATTY